jgi:predicted nuclease of predicted toxin-antitoxin system
MRLLLDENLPKKLRRDFDNSYLTLKELAPKILAIIDGGLMSGPIEVRV